MRRNPQEPPTNNFLTLLENFKLRFILQPGKPSEFKPICIAVLDTGLCIDESDALIFSAHETGRLRKDLSRNFTGPEGNWEDEHGHGTHVTRLLLRCTVGAEIMILKVAEDGNMTRSQLSKLIEVSIRLLSMAKDT